MILSRTEINVVVARSTSSDARELFPILLLGPRVAGFAVAQVLGRAVGHDYLGVTQVAIIGDLLLGADEEVRFAAFHARQQFAAMNLVHENLELKALAGLGVG